MLLPHRAALVLASSSAYKRFSELLPKEQRDNACSLRVPKSRILTLPELRVRSLAAAGPRAAPWGAASGQGSAHPSGPPWCPRSVLAVLLRLTLGQRITTPYQPCPQLDPLSPLCRWAEGPAAWGGSAALCAMAWWQRGAPGGVGQCSTGPGTTGSLP